MHILRVVKFAIRCPMHLAPDQETRKHQLRHVGKFKQVFFICYASQNLLWPLINHGGTLTSYTNNMLKYHTYIYHFQPNRFSLPFPTMHLYEVHTSQHCSRTLNHHSHRLHNCEEKAHPDDRQHEQKHRL